MKFTTLLIDADVLLHRACVAGSTTLKLDDDLIQSVNLPTAKGWIKRELAKYRKRLGAKDCILALGDRKANFRKDLSPAYKAARRVMPKPPGFAELEADLEAHAEVRREPRLEGDDILGLLATKAPTDGKVVVSIDKDLKQIPGWHYNPDTDDLSEVSPEEGARFHLFQTLVGDRVDGYPGCPGVGKVRAEKILAARPDRTYWENVVEAYEKAGLTGEDALLQGRLAFVLRQGYYSRVTKEIKLWVPST